MSGGERRDGRIDERTTTPVWITGVGPATPLGHRLRGDRREPARGAVGGPGGDEFPVADQPSRIAGRLDRIPCPPGWAADEFEARRPLERVVLWSCVAALRDSGWWDRRREVRVGLVLGLGAEWLITWEGDAAAAARVAQALRTPSRPSHSSARTGPERARRLGVSAACASGNHALALARRWLRTGLGRRLPGRRRATWPSRRCRWPASATSAPLAAERRPGGGLAPVRPRPRRVRDRRGRGRVRPEAVAVGPQRRGARAYAAVAGFGASSDAHHAVIPSPDPAPAVAAMRQALADAGVVPERDRLHQRPRHRARRSATSWRPTPSDGPRRGDRDASRSARPRA